MNARSAGLATALLFLAVAAPTSAQAPAVSPAAKVTPLLTKPLAGVTLPPTGKPSKALLLVTKTLLFAAEGYGGGPILRAFDKASGKVVAELPLPGVASGKPMSYLLGGKQYIVLAVGKDHPAELVALALP